MTMKSNRRGFTMMEMLLVVAVLAIVSAILLPMGNKVVLKAKVATVKKAITDFEKAVESYRQEYGRLPIPNGIDINDIAYNDGGSNVVDIIEALAGSDTVAGIPNPKGIIFFQCDMVTSSGEFKDSWGKNIRLYFDANYDDVIDGSVTGQEDFRGRSTVAVSSGPDGLYGNDYQRSDDISSVMR